MKGYYTKYSYMGWLPSIQKYVAFATIKEYEEYYMETEQK